LAKVRDNDYADDNAHPSPSQKGDAKRLSSEATPKLCRAAKVASEAAVAVAKDVGCVLDTDETLTQGRDWASEVAALKQKALRLERKLDEKTKGEETSALAKALEDEKTKRKREEASALAKAVEEAEKAKEVRVQAQLELVEAMASRKEVEASVLQGAQATQGLHRRKGKPKDNVLLEKISAKKLRKALMQIR